MILTDFAWARFAGLQQLLYIHKITKNRRNISRTFLFVGGDTTALIQSNFEFTPKMIEFRIFQLHRSALDDVNFALLDDFEKLQTILTEGD